MTRRTKIVATIGPASDNPSTLQDLMRAGVDVVRLNLSHGTVDEHLERLHRVRSAADTVGRQVAVLADLPGPKFRSGRFPEGGVDLVVGNSIELRAGDEPSDATCLHVQYPTLIEDLAVGAHIQIGDGIISMSVTSIGDECAIAYIETGGRANGQPGVANVLASRRNGIDTTLTGLGRSSVSDVERSDVTIPAEFEPITT